MPAANSNLSCSLTSQGSKRRAVVAALATMALAYAGISPAQAQSTTTFALTALASGNWNSAGIHTVGNYQVGHSNELPNNQAAYFEFDLDPVKGRNLVSSSVLIIGSTDYNITDVFAQRCGKAPCFKLGIAPQGPFSTDQIVNPASNHNINIYLDGDDENRNQDLGYNWVENGLHPGLKFIADTYNVQRLQAEINAGGKWVFWARDRFDFSEGTVGTGDACPACPGGQENYIWGTTAFTTAIKLYVTVKNGAKTTAQVQTGTYHIKNLNSGLLLEVPAGHTAAGTTVDQAMATQGSNQLWHVTRMGTNTYTITNASTGLALDTASDAAPVDAAMANGETNQQWILTGTTDGNYTITSRNSGLLMGAADSTTLPTAVVELAKPNGIASQQWSFY